MKKTAQLRYDQALQFLQPYIEHNPSNNALWVVLAEIHEYRDKNSAAISALQKAKQILERRNKKSNAENLQYVNIKLSKLTAMKSH